MGIIVDFHFPKIGHIWIYKFEIANSRWPMKNVLYLDIRNSFPNALFYYDNFLVQEIGCEVSKPWLSCMQTVIRLFIRFPQYICCMCLFKFVFVFTACMKWAILTDLITLARSSAISTQDPEILVSITWHLSSHFISICSRPPPQADWLTDHWWEPEFHLSLGKSDRGNCVDVCAREASWAVAALRCEAQCACTLIFIQIEIYNSRADFKADHTVEEMDCSGSLHHFINKHVYSWNRGICETLHNGHL